MMYWEKILKNNKGASSIEIVAWFSIIYILLVMGFLIIPKIFSSDDIVSNAQNHTVISDKSINKNNADEILNNIKEKEPTTQNIVINNIVKEDSSNFLKDVNVNIISDIIATSLIAIAGFFIGKFSKAKTVKL